MCLDKKAETNLFNYISNEISYQHVAALQYSTIDDSSWTTPLKKNKKVMQNHY